MQMQMFGPGYSLSADKLSSLLRPIAVGTLEDQGQLFRRGGGHLMWYSHGNFTCSG